MIQITYLQFLGQRALHVNRVLCYRNCVDVNRDNLPAIMWSMVKPFMVFYGNQYFMSGNHFYMCLVGCYNCNVHLNNNKIIARLKLHQTSPQA